MDQGLIQAHTMATRAACVRMTTARLRALHDSVEQASGLRGSSGWDRRASAHAEIFTLLAGMTDDAAVAPVLLGAADVVCRLMIVAGPAANGMIVSSRQRLLAYLRAGDTDGATLEMERHLRGLHFMSRLVGDDPGAVLIVRPRRPAEQAAGSPGQLSHDLRNHGRTRKGSGCPHGECNCGVDVSSGRPAGRTENQPEEKHPDGCTDDEQSHSDYRDRRGPDHPTHKRGGSEQQDQHQEALQEAVPKDHGCCPSGRPIPGRVHQARHPLGRRDGREHEVSPEAARCSGQERVRLPG